MEVAGQGPNIVIAGLNQPLMHHIGHGAGGDTVVDGYAVAQVQEQLVFGPADRSAVVVAQRRREPAVDQGPLVVLPVGLCANRIARRMAGGAVPQAFGQVLSAAGILFERGAIKVQQLPARLQHANAEREAQGVFRRLRVDGLAGHHVGV